MARELGRSVRKQSPSVACSASSDDIADGPFLDKFPGELLEGKRRS